MRGGWLEGARNGGRVRVFRALLRVDCLGCKGTVKQDLHKEEEEHCPQNGMKCLLRAHVEVRSQARHTRRLTRERPPYSGEKTRWEHSGHRSCPPIFLFCFAF